MFPIHSKSVSFASFYLYLPVLTKKECVFKSIYHILGLGPPKCSDPEAQKEWIPRQIFHLFANAHWENGSTPALQVVCSLSLCVLVNVVCKPLWKCSVLQCPCLQQVPFLTTPLRFALWDHKQGSFLALQRAFGFTLHALFKGRPKGMGNKITGKIREHSGWFQNYLFTAIFIGTVTDQYVDKFLHLFSPPPHPVIWVLPGKAPDYLGEGCEISGCLKLFWEEKLGQWVFPGGWIAIKICHVFSLNRVIRNNIPKIPLEFFTVVNARYLAQKTREKLVKTFFFFKMAFRAITPGFVKKHKDYESHPEWVGDQTTPADDDDRGVERFSPVSNWLGAESCFSGVLWDPRRWNIWAPRSPHGTR